MYYTAEEDSKAASLHGYLRNKMWEVEEWTAYTDSYCLHTAGYADETTERSMILVLFGILGEGMKVP